MKALLGIPIVQNLIAATVVGYLRFCFATTRWHIVGQAPVEALWTARTPIVLALWHQRIHMSHASWPTDRAPPIAVLASLSKAGDISVKINQSFDHHLIRGSSAKKSDPTKDKRGTQAFRELLRWLKGDETGGRAVAMTPDGPRGPAKVMTDGTLKLAQLARAPIVLLGQATGRYIELKSWDRMRIPLPFTKGAMVWDVLPPPTASDEAAFEALRLEAEHRLTAVTQKADRLMGIVR